MLCIQIVILKECEVVRTRHIDFLSVSFRSGILAARSEKRLQKVVSVSAARRMAVTKSSGTVVNSDKPDSIGRTQREGE